MLRKAMSVQQDQHWSNPRQLAGCQVRTFFFIFESRFRRAKNIWGLPLALLPPPTKKPLRFEGKNKGKIGKKLEISGKIYERKVKE